MKIGVGMGGRFMGEGWSRTSVVSDAYIHDSGSNHLAGMIGRPLLGQVGWAPHHIMATDLQTSEGAIFHPGGLARYDLDKHQLWVCVLFEEFPDVAVQAGSDRSPGPTPEGRTRHRECLWDHRRPGPGNFETHDPTRGSDPVEHAEPATQDDGGVRV